MVSSEVLFIAAQLLSMGMAAPIDTQAAVAEGDSRAQLNESTDTAIDVSLDRRGCNEPPCAKPCCLKPCFKPCCLKPPCPCDIANCICGLKPCGHASTNDCGC